MQGKATIARHPIHPMLVALPIGFFAGVLVSDVISIWGDRLFWSQMSVWLIAFGVAGALLAALFGFIDYFTAPMSLKTKRWQRRTWYLTSSSWWSMLRHFSSGTQMYGSFRYV